MAFRTGRCTNDLFCSFASGRQDLQVPADGNFVCPQCGKSLSDPPQDAGPGKMRLALVAGGSLATAGALLFLAGMFMGNRTVAPPTASPQFAAAAKPEPQVEPEPAPKPAPSVASQPESSASPGPAASQSTPAQPEAPAAPAMQGPSTPKTAAPPPVTTVAAQPAQIVAPPQQPPQPTVQLAMVEQPRPAPGRPLALPPPPQATPKPDQAEQQRRAQAATEQAKRAQALAEQAKRAQLLAEQTKKEKALVEAKRERQAALDDQRKLAEQRAAREEAEQEEAAARARAAQLESAKAPPPAAPPVTVAAIQAPAPKPAPAPSGPSRAFSTSPVAGGAPAYPSEFENSGRSGSVTVSCRIQEDGHPAGCHVVSSRGGEPFKGAVLGWLNSGRVRYQPILRNGKSVAETHQWNVQFQPD